MKKVLTHAARAVLLLAIWGLATLAVLNAARALGANRAKAAQVAELESRYNARMDEYAGVLVVGDKLENDHEYKINLLKERFGYAEPDETPIVILSDPAADASAAE